MQTVTINLTDKFTDNLKLLLAIRQKSVVDLAIELKITRQAVNNYCSGKSKPPYDILVKICEFLQCSPNQIMGWKE